MKPVLKIDLESRLSSGEPIVLELGCGPNKKPGRIGIDRIDLPGVDIVADVDEGLGFLPDGSVDAIYSESFFEHVSDLEQLVTEVVRVLRPHGYNWLFVPHFSNQHYYSDYTQVVLRPLHAQILLRRRASITPQGAEFLLSTRIRVLSQRMIFFSSFKGIRLLKKVFQKLVNLNSWTQEFYEENLCYIIPCYGMKIRFGRT